MNLENYYNFLKNQKSYSSHTCKAYVSDISSFLDFIKSESVEIDGVDFNVIRYYLVLLSQNELSKRSIRRILSSLKSYYKYLIDLEVVDKNPVTMVDTLKQDFKLPEYLYIEEVQELFKSCNLSKNVFRDKLIIGLLFLTGVRVSELVNINLNDIKDNTVKVLGKGNKERYIILTSNLKAILDKYISNDRLACDSDALLVNNRGKRLTDRGVRYILNSIAKKSKLDKNIYPHLLRHSFATHFLMESNDLRSVQIFLGHENLTTTQVYTHISNQQIVDAYKKYHPRHKNKS